MSFIQIRITPHRESLPFLEDGVPPLFSYCPGNISKNATSGIDSSIQIAWGRPTATDNSGIKPSVNLSSDTQKGPYSLFTFGVHFISYSATDMSGNVAFCNFTVTVGKF